VAVGDHGAADEVVAAIVESSLRGSAVPPDAERTYTAEPGKPAPASRRLRAGPPAASTATPPSSGVTAGRSTAGGGSHQVVSADVSRDGAEAGAAERSDGGESVVGVWLLLVTGIAGALLILGAGLRTDAPGRRR
jgi:hypothetical protein